MGKFKEKGYFIQSLAAISIVMLGIGGVQSASAGLDDGQINLEARLNQDYRVRLSIEIENMSMNCESFSAKMSGVEIVGYFEYNNGVCNLNLDPRQGDTVPAVAAGDEVYVFGNGVTLTGILHFK